MFEKTRVSAGHGHLSAAIREHSAEWLALPIRTPMAPDEVVGCKTRTVAWDFPFLSEATAFDLSSCNDFCS
jgi:hypothetical protein